MASYFQFKTFASEDMLIFIHDTMFLNEKVECSQFYKISVKYSQTQLSYWFS